MAANKTTKKKRHKRMAVLIILSALLLVAVYEDTHFIVSDYIAESEKLPESFDGVKLLFLSDLHSRSYYPDNAPLVERIEQINPDYIIAGGDMLSSHEPDGSVFLALCERLNSYPIYYTFGNHEDIARISNMPEITEYTAKLSKAGVNILNDKRATLTRGDGQIELYGLDLDLWYYTKRSELAENGLDMKSSDIAAMLDKPQSDRYNVLLAHSPFYPDVYAEWGADLVLSGHVHGGLIRLPLLGGLLSPEVSFFPKYDKGAFLTESSLMLVSAGIGNHYRYLRLFNPPEIVVVTLKKINGGNNERQK